MFLYLLLVPVPVLAVQVGDWLISENQESGTRSHFICVDAVDCVTASEDNVFLVPLDTFPREETRLIVRGGIDVAARALARVGETGKGVTDEGFCFECLLDLQPGSWSMRPAVVPKTDMLDDEVTKTTLELLRKDFLSNTRELLSSRLSYRRVANICEILGNSALYLGVALSSISTTIPVLGDYKDICDKLSFVSTGLFATHVMLIGCARCSSREQKERENLLKDHADMVGFQLKSMQSVVTDEADNMRLAANQLMVNQFRRKQRVTGPSDRARSDTPQMNAMSVSGPTSPRAVVTDVVFRQRTHDPPGSDARAHDMLTFSQLGHLSGPTIPPQTGPYFPIPPEGSSSPFNMEGGNHFTRGPVPLR